LHVDLRRCRGTPPEEPRLRAACSSVRTAQGPNRESPEPGSSRVIGLSARTTTDDIRNSARLTLKKGLRRLGPLQSDLPPGSSIGRSRTQTSKSDANRPPTRLFWFMGGRESSLEALEAFRPRGKAVMVHFGGEQQFQSRPWRRSRISSNADRPIQTQSLPGSAGNDQIKTSLDRPAAKDGIERCVSLVELCSRPWESSPRVGNETSQHLVSIFRVLVSSVMLKPWPGSALGGIGSTRQKSHSRADQDPRATKSFELSYVPSTWHHPGTLETRSSKSVALHG